MAGLSYDPGVLHGERRDPSLQWERVRGLDDLRLAKLAKALVKTAASYREHERSRLCPPDDYRDQSDEAYAERSKAYNRFCDRINGIDNFIGQKVVSMIGESDSNPNRVAMYSKSAIFQHGEQPLLYVEHWGTTDLDDSDRDAHEIQMFVGLNGHLKTDIGRRLAHSVLDSIFDGTMMSESEIPGDLATFGTVPREVFEPFIRTDVAAN